MKKVLLSVFLVDVVVGGVAWSERIEVLLAVVKYTSAKEYDVAENRPIPWQQGPVAAAVTDGEQPPNIILIVADDLGFNDISTFGGGVACGQLKTPGRPSRRRRRGVSPVLFGCQYMCALPRHDDDGTLSRANWVRIYADAIWHGAGDHADLGRDG